jgi:hypothetical protein
MHVPDEIRSTWEIKLDRLEARGATDFPKLPLVAVILSGQSSDSLPTAALGWQIATYPNELPIDVGSAFCEKLDKELFGGRLTATARASCVLATDESLIYVIPQRGLHRRWSWAEINVEKRRSIAALSSVNLRTPTATYKISMGAGAAANISYISSRLR